MSTIYLENRHQISSETLAEVSNLEAIPYVNEVDDSLRAALVFAWQWLRGDQEFEQLTSGSTGKAKTITIAREKMIISARITLDALQLNQRDSALLCLNADYIGGKMMIVRSLLAGINLVMVPPTAHPLTSLPFLPKFVAMVPLQILTLLEAGETDQLNQMKAIIVGGAAVSTSLEKKIACQLSVPVYSTYGMTETVSHIALRKLTPPNASPYFEVLGDTQIDTDERGCLQINGEITDQKWLSTNDLVRLVDDKHFRWLGRYDFIINSGGVKVSPETVEVILESILQSLGFAGRLLVSSLPDKKLGERVILLLEGGPIGENFEARLLAKAKEHLPPYHTPKEIYYLSKFSQTSSGKIQRTLTQAQVP